MQRVHEMKKRQNKTLPEKMSCMKYLIKKKTETVSYALNLA